MPELVALDLPAGPAFVRALRSAWESGTPCSPSTPASPARPSSRLIDVLQPAR